MATLNILTTEGIINLVCRPDAAPTTVAYIARCVRDGLYDGRSFYRSDFVIQCGLHGSGVANPHGDLAVNETATGVRLSNTRGTAAIAHHDVPDCGNAEFFINLQSNAHLDVAYGGYAVFAEVRDEQSFQTIDAVARKVKEGSPVKIVRMQVE